MLDYHPNHPDLPYRRHGAYEVKSALIEKDPVSGARCPVPWKAVPPVGAHFDDLIHQSSSEIDPANCVIVRDALAIGRTASIQVDGLVYEFEPICLLFETCIESFQHGHLAQPKVLP